MMIPGVLLARGLARAGTASRLHRLDLSGNDLDAGAAAALGSALAALSGQQQQQHVPEGVQLAATAAHAAAAGPTAGAASSDGGSEDEGQQSRLLQFCSPRVRVRVRLRRGFSSTFPTTSARVPGRPRRRSWLRSAASQGEPLLQQPPLLRAGCGGCQETARAMPQREEQEWGEAEEAPSSESLC